jgi:hypothetical protein
MSLYIITFVMLSVKIRDFVSQCRFIETIQVIKFIGIIADMFWTSTAYHESAYYGNIWSVVILIEHRWFFVALISAGLSESTRIKSSQNPPHF